MTKDDIIYKFISEQLFPNVNWARYNLHNQKGMYLSCNYWCKISDMFSISKDETKQYLNKWVHSNVDNIHPEFSVILESLFIEEEMYD